MAKDHSQSTASPPKAKAAPRAGGTKSAMGGMLSDPFRLVFFLAVNVSVVVGIVSTAVILRHRTPPPKPITLAAALSALDRGNAAEAERMAEHLAASKDLTTDDWGGPDYIQGTLIARAAESASGQERIDLFRQASLYLARSRERGFPDHRDATGLALLGKCLFLCGRTQEALPVLEQALQRSSDSPVALRMMLIEARVGVQPPELDKALAENQKLLADLHLVDPELRQALVQQAQILIRMNRAKDCAAVLNKIPDNPLLRSDVTLLRGRIAFREGQELKKSGAVSPSLLAPLPKGEGSSDRDATEKFRSAIELFRRAISQDVGDYLVARQATYLIGLGLLEQGDLAAALNQMERTARFFPDTPEQLAALYQQGEIARRLDRHKEAVLAYRRLLSAYARQDEFQNPWLDLSQMKASLLAVCLGYVKAEKYQSAVLLSKSLAQLLPKAEALQLTARIYQTWGDNLQEQAERLPPDKAEAFHKQARAQMRLAGDSYLALAREQFTTRQYPEQLWNGASAYFAGHDFRTAAKMLRLYMRNEPRLRHAQALVDLGEAQLSLGQTDEALQSFRDCIQQHPRDVAVYRARLLASRAALNLGDAKQAESFLQDNLSGDQLTPASKEWRDSLFALAELLHNNARHREAILRLDEALQRYPESPQATLARYLLADSARRLATELHAGLGKEISSAVRSQRATQSKHLLDRALESYRSLQDNLGRGDDESLTAQDKAILRNCRFALGDTYFALKRYREALRAYQSAADHYATDPEVLDAYLQMANVYRSMERPAEARTSLEQARLALRRIPSEARFEQVTNFNRKQWGELLDRLCSI